MFLFIHRHPRLIKWQWLPLKTSLIAVLAPSCTWAKVVTIRRNCSPCATSPSSASTNHLLPSALLSLSFFHGESHDIFYFSLVLVCTPCKPRHNSTWSKWLLNNGSLICQMWYKWSTAHNQQLEQCVDSLSVETGVLLCFSTLTDPPLSTGHLTAIVTVFKGWNVHAPHKLQAECHFIQFVKVRKRKHHSTTQTRAHFHLLLFLVHRASYR